MADAPDTSGRGRHDTSDRHRGRGIAMKDIVRIPCSGILVGLLLGAITPEGAQASAERSAGPEASSVRRYSPLGLATVSVPSTWQEWVLGESVVYAPPGGITTRGEGRYEIIRGFELGAFSLPVDDVTRAAEALVGSMARGQSHQKVIRSGPGTLAGRNAVMTILSNVNAVTTGQETVVTAVARHSERRFVFVVMTVPHGVPGAHAEEVFDIFDTLALSDTQGGARREQTGALTGTWRSPGVILTLNADGSFSRTSNSAYGSFGGVVGLDDAGTYEVRDGVLVLEGAMRTRECEYSLQGSQMTLCGIPYSRER